MRVFLYILLGLALLGVIFIGAMSFLDTYERAQPDVLPGYAADEITVDHRDAPLPVHVWYPAEQEGQAQLIGQNALFFGEHVLRDAAPRSGAKPVVVIAHGSCGNAPRLGWLATRLETRGFVVIGTNHPGATSGDSDPHQLTDVAARVADVKALMDFIEGPGGAALGADAGRLAVLGFSLGGPTAFTLAGLRLSKAQFLDYCAEGSQEIDCLWASRAGVDHTALDAARYEADHSDPRIDAAVLVDPVQMQAIVPETLPRMTVPSLVVNLGDTDVPASVRADWLAGALPDAEYRALPGQSNHFGFLAECSSLGKIVIRLAGEEDICGETGALSRATVHADMVRVIGDFLTRTLAPDTGG